MADKHLDPEDPFTLNGHAVAVSPEEAEVCMIEMTDTVISEFSALGWPREMIFKMFKKPLYQMPFMIAQTKGDAFVQDRIERYFSRPILTLR